MSCIQNNNHTPPIENPNLNHEYVARLENCWSFQSPCNVTDLGQWLNRGCPGVSAYPFIKRKGASATFWLQVVNTYTSLFIFLIHTSIQSGSILIFVLSLVFLTQIWRTEMRHLETRLPESSRHLLSFLLSGVERGWNTSAAFHPHRTLRRLLLS